MSQSQKDIQHQDALDLKAVQVLADAIDKALQHTKGDQRFIDISRIPLICLSITGIHESLKEIKEMVSAVRSEYITKDQCTPVKNVVFGLVALMLSSVVVALISMVVRK